MRTLRRTLQQVAKQRGRPLLIGARVPETVVGCHFDGIDIELWMRERLVDVLTLGCRTMEVDLADFRRLADETGIKLYPCTDFVHKPDGYDPGVAAVGRGIYANWWQQGAGRGQHVQLHVWRPGLAFVRGDWEPWNFT